MIVAHPGRGVIGLAKGLIKDSRNQLSRITLLHSLSCADAVGRDQDVGRGRFGMAAITLGCSEPTRGRGEHCISH